MRTTLNLSEELISNVIRETGIKNKTKLIHLALEEFLRKLKRKNVKNLYGKINVDTNILKMRDIE